ncbi:PREDICTED: uncharacterized protein LOC106725965 [Myotis brandtii]|uniref:uncharacterized protein LOC106725965 n=1 Tax=Myotis brandtii TaxID=109478 RepID=UPI0007045138|nr:PREDICTED: uncharacterized protein LOC106725965 [Myotis brandtii]
MPCFPPGEGTGERPGPQPHCPRLKANTSLPSGRDGLSLIPDVPSRVRRLLRKPPHSRNDSKRSESPTAAPSCKLTLTSRKPRVPHPRHLVSQIDPTCEHVFPLPPPCGPPAPAADSRGGHACVCRQHPLHPDCPEQSEEARPAQREHVKLGPGEKRLGSGATHASRRWDPQDLGQALVSAATSGARIQAQEDTEAGGQGT